MAQFKYTINSPEGKVITKIITSATRESAQKMLEKDGSLIVSLKEIKQHKKWWEWSSSLRQKDIIMITKRIGDMTGHGFSVVDALRTIELQAHSPTLKKVVQDVKSQIEMGNSLSNALASYPRYFSNVFVSLVKVGEESGTLPKVLKYLEKQENQMYKLKKKAVSAMIYPAVIMSMMVIIGIGMVMFLIPFLRDIFSSFEADLPLPTRILMGTEEFIRTKGYLMLAGIVLSVISVKVAFRSKAVRRTWDKFLLHIPILGSVIKSYNAARIIRTFATLNKTGVPMIQSLDILKTVPKNTAYSGALHLVREDVNKGKIFSAAMEIHPKLFSPLVIESIKLGEDAGNLGDSMNYLAEVFEDEVKGQIKALTTFIQPFLLVLVGLMVAGFALSVIVPLQRIPSLIQQ